MQTGKKYAAKNSDTRMSIDNCGGGDSSVATGSGDSSTQGGSASDSMGGVNSRNVGCVAGGRG